MLKFPLDAQLPRSLTSLFAEFGIDSKHTLDLPNANRTKDSELLRISREERYLIVTKDNDFVESFLLRHEPEKPLFVSCGNLSNPSLTALFRPNLARIAEAFELNDFIELTREDIIIHS